MMLKFMISFNGIKNFFLRHMNTHYVSKIRTLVTVKWENISNYANQK